ncbi:hypothetical protein [Nocardioides sp. NPDC006303]|uniref:P-loop NTPase n=1 Tax=Nocardioides sp. NPDC006303 TaxID=3156747 RepID=UPI0033B673EB
MALESGSDPVRQLVASKYGPGEGAGYDQILVDDFTSQIEAAVHWLDRQSSGLPQPPSLQTVASFPWSSLYTSAVDSTWIEAFRTDWRQLRPIYNELQRPDQPRSKIDLVCTLLFGSARWHEVAPIPSSQIALRVRRPAATSLLRRLPELLTPRGVLAIEGYAADDWLTPDDLLSSLDMLADQQAHLFSVSPDLRDLDVIQYLTSSNKLVLHEESLASAVQRGIDQGLLRAGTPDTGLETGHRIELTDDVLNVPRELWKRVSRSAFILNDDDVFAQPPPLSKAARYAAFRKFLETSEGKPDWHAYARGFAFERDFEHSLFDVASMALAAKQLQERPILLHGATGTGKSVAMARLAYRIRLERKYPVLYIPNRVKVPALDDIDEFVRWAETAGAPAVLVVWDGMATQDEYDNLVGLLTTRGRKAVVVGSAYRQEPTQDLRGVEVPRALTNEELTRFSSYLQQVDPDIASATPASAFMQGNEFLVSLYRLLPQSRLQLRQGVAREVGFAEAVMSRKERESSVIVTPRTAMEWALFDSGVLEDLPPLLTESTDLAGEAVQNVQRLTGLVMVPGQFGLPIPLELVLRALGHGSYSNFGELLRGTDVFEWYEDPEGNIDIGPRTSLEAQIITQSRLGGPSSEVSVSCELIREMTLDSISSGGNREADFIARLAQAFDSDRAGVGYRPYFNELATALEFLRTERSVQIPELMLQEAHLRREWTRSVEESATPDDRLQALVLAREVLESALEVEADLHRRHKFMRMSLLTELASTLATTARLQVTAFEERTQALADYDAAKAAIEEARRLAPENYYSLDVLAWATFDLIGAGLLEGDSQLEAIANLIVAFETSDLGGAGTNADMMLRRRMQIGQLFGKAELEDSAYADLLSRGSTSGIILRAVKRAGGPRMLDWQQEEAAAAFEYAEAEAQSLSKVDQRFREVILNLWFVGVSGHAPFDRERIAASFAMEEWQQLDALTRAALASGESTRATNLLFLRGLAEFHLGSYGQSLETFRQVERDSVGMRSRWNVIRSYVASDSSGKPRQFHGVVVDAYEGGSRGELYIEEIQQRIAFRGRDFGGDPFARGDALPPLNIAFSLQGPIADPVSAYDVARDREKKPRSAHTRSRR